MRLRVKIKNPIWARRDRYAFPIPEFFIYEGEVLNPKPRWVGSERFCLTTGDPKFTFRVLEKDAIECGWLIK